MKNRNLKLILLLIMIPSITLGAQYFVPIEKKYTIKEQEKPQEPECEFNYYTANYDLGMFAGSGYRWDKYNISGNCQWCTDHYEGGYRYFQGKRAEEEKVRSMYYICREKVQ